MRDLGDRGTVSPIAPLTAVALVRGCPRSGTTLLAEIINLCDGAGIQYEYPLGQLARDLEPLLTYADSQAAWRLIVAENSGAMQSLRDGVYNAHSHLERDPIRYPVREQLGKMIAAIVGVVVGKTNLRVVGSKTPGLAALDDVRYLESIFTDVFHLFVVRNPLDTINSSVNRRNLSELGADEWHVRNVVDAIRDYRDATSVLLSHVRAFGSRVFVFKYEDLVERFANTVSHLDGLLGLQVPEPDSDDPEALCNIVRRRPSESRHILTAEEREAVDAEFQTAIEGWRDARMTGPGPAVENAMAPCVEVLEPGRDYVYSAKIAKRWGLGLAWSAIEDDGVWSTAPEADLFFRVPWDATIAATLDLGFLFGPSFRERSIVVSIDGTTTYFGIEKDATEVGARYVALGESRSIVTKPFYLRRDEIHRLAIRLDNAYAPRDYVPPQLSSSVDARTLGVFLRRLTLIDSSPNDRS